VLEIVHCVLLAATAPDRGKDFDIFDLDCLWTGGPARELAESLCSEAYEIVADVLVDVLTSHLHWGVE
jgi:hypothetical protein